jgi:hypothetical protein
MTCREVNEYLDGNGLGDLAVLPEMLHKHLDNCACCRALWDLLSRRPCPKRVPVQVRDTIQEELFKSLKPVAPLPSAGKLMLGFAVIFGGLSGMFAALNATAGAPGATSFPFAAVLGVVVAAGLLLSWVLSREMAPGEKRYLAPALLLGSSLAALYAAVGLVFPWTPDETLWARHWHCFREGFLVSLPGAALILLLLWRGAVLSPGIVGALAGLLAALVGVLSLHFSCTLATAPHIAAGHLMVPVSGVVIGYVAGRLLPGS